MSTACAHFPQSSRVHSSLRSLERRVTPAYLEVKMQNSATRIITRTSYISHITSVLQQLHWLPIENRIINKKLLLKFKAISHLAPMYLTELRHINAPTRSLRTFSSIQLILPPAHLVTMGSRAFSRSAPPPLEFSASWHPTLHFHYHFQISLENTSIQASPLLLKSVASLVLEWPRFFFLFFCAAAQNLEIGSL